MVGMCVGQDRVIDFIPGIDIEIACGAIESTRGAFEQLGKTGGLSALSIAWFGHCGTLIDAIKKENTSRDLEVS